ncbi:MAG: family 10 glycosylhydrolase [Bacteroidales bacterium]|nr:family 10 glycosylhydrolase [Bacteroidales bacterium]MCF8391149.1 family 10 glycosylhydrolase [Bacteroidales bacterium]
MNIYPKKIVKSLTVILILMFLTHSLLKAQNPKREFRAVWVSSVVNIDWPSKSGLSTMEQTQEIQKILDKHKENGINAIILQVRPAADAIYNSPLEPWSRYLSGTQGIAPQPYYDPLELWINECHKRGMELHAWLNPYRVKQNLEDSLAANHILNTHPEWAWEYGERVYFAPDNPEVWNFVKQVVVDIVSRYDVDAIHFDDYFYPYEIQGVEIPDQHAFETRGGAYYPDRKEDWRRHNVDTIIQMLSIAIKDEKPWVKFGISPFGVWRNRTQDPMGSETKAGTTNYDGLYADVIYWQKMGWIDYLMPQLYWRDDHPVADYSSLAYWWNDFSYGRAMYFGLAPYRIDKKSDYKLWKKDKYFLDQIDLLRTLENVNGFGFFSSKHFFRKDLESLNKKLQKNYCSSPAIVPEMPWINAIAPAAPYNLKLNGDTLSWENDQNIDEMNNSRFFVLYYYNKESSRYLKESSRIIQITGEKNFIFKEGIKKGVYRLSSLDRLNNESQLSKELIVH